MKFIQGKNRTKINLFTVSLDQSIAPDNGVRIIDLFVDLANSNLGFMFIAYNLRRIGNILSRDRLKEYLRMLDLLFLNRKGLFWSKSSPIKPVLSDMAVLNRNFFRVTVAA